MMPARTGKKGKEAAVAAAAAAVAAAVGGPEEPGTSQDSVADFFPPEPTPAPPPEHHSGVEESDTEEHAKAKKKSGKGGGGKKGKRGKGKGKLQQELEQQNGAEPVTLFEIVKQGKGALQSVVDEWIESYKNDRDAAVIDLINYFMQCSGCKGLVTPEMYVSGNMDYSDIIRKMTEEFDEESGDYPLIQTGPAFRKFKNNFCEFVQLLVRQCQYSILYDQYLMDNVISLLTGLSDSQVRAFRHTSTLAAMKLMTALVNVALNLSVSQDNTQRQYDAEKAKQMPKRAAERLEMLLAKRKELQENMEEVNQMMNNIFKGVFVHRYRDTQPEIRAICLGEIGIWMKNYSETFLSDSYLKYVGWTLHDKVGEVRQKCLFALIPLYSNPELAPKLELFTNRFKDRIVSMTLDKEVDVAVQAIKVVTLIFKFNEEILSTEDRENVYQLVYSSHRNVAQAAGEFLNECLFKRDDVQASHRSNKRRSPNAPLIKDMVQFFIESELHEHAAYLVDALWDINEMVKDWDCMTELLLEEPGRGEDALDDRQETALIEVMVSAVRQAAHGHPPVGRGSAKKQILTSKEKKAVMDDKMKLSEHFITKLPELLAKYIVDAEKLANLLEIPQHFDVEIYTTSRLEKHLDTLLKHMKEIVEKHTESEVLDACAKTIEYLCNEEYAIQPKVDVARSTLIDGLVEKTKRSYKAFMEADEPDEDDIYAVSSSIKRINAFYNYHDLTGWNLYDMLYTLVKQGNDRSVPEEILTKAISCIQCALMWSLKRLDESNPDKGDMKKLRKRVSDTMKQCNNLMLINSNTNVKEEAFITVCDLLVTFSKQLGKCAAVLNSLVYTPDRDLQDNLTSFISENIFVEDEDGGHDDEEEGDDSAKIEMLHKRRNLLACFCKLIVFNIIEMKAAASVFKHYMKYYNDYGDIIKMTLAKSREINKVDCARTLGLSLAQLFTEMKEEEEFDQDRASQQMNAIKELARRFSLTFGLDQIKTRDAVAALHKEGIVFSLTPLENPRDPSGPPPNIGYLEVLSEFSSKLMRQDKKTVLSYLDKSLKEGMLEQEGEKWQSIKIYRNCLLQTDNDGGPGRATGKSGKVGKGHGHKGKHGMKRKLMMQAEDESSTDSQWVSKEQMMQQQQQQQQQQHHQQQYQQHPQQQHPPQHPHQQQQLAPQPLPQQQQHFQHPQQQHYLQQQQQQLQQQQQQQQQQHMQHPHRPMEPQQGAQQILEAMSGGPISKRRRLEEDGSSERGDESSQGSDKDFEGRAALHQEEDDDDDEEDDDDIDEDESSDDEGQEDMDTGY
ncbi:cohesin subunit SA-2-like isoform X2 [Ptychodera flava]|uniref:cohesin subunit SA-2-like isoform X2 n=1 Tax=Ptychodera flava TaxID=63121 RepID=UPI00396A1CB0